MNLPVLLRFFFVCWKYAVFAQPARLLSHQLIVFHRMITFVDDCLNIYSAESYKIIFRV